jgi:fructokinase
MARFGSDGFGTLARARAEAAGVLIDRAVDAPEPAALAIVTRSDDGTPQYAFHLAGAADWQWSDGELDAPAPDAVHVGSLALALQPGAAAIERRMERLREQGATVISFDPNVRPALGLERAAERRRVLRQARLAHLVKVSDEDLAWLEPDASAEDAIAAWRQAGVDGAVVLTRGARGASVHTASGRVVDVSASRVQVVDTVGAGDALAAGVLAALDERGLLRVDALAQVPAESWQEVLAFAVRVAAITCTRVGSDPPTRDEVDAGARTVASR